MRVGDAYFKLNKTVAVMMENINIKEKSGEELAITDTSKKQLVEAIGNDEKTVFSLTFDQAGMEKNLKSREIKNFPDCFKSIDALFHTINENTGRILEEEIEFWEDYRDESVDLYLDRIKYFLKKVKGVKSENASCVCHMGQDGILLPEDGARILNWWMMWRMGKLLMRVDQGMKGNIVICPSLNPEGSPVKLNFQVLLG